MKIVNIYEAKTHLSRLLREVALGEDIVIAKDGRPLARLVPVAAEDGERDLGFAAGRVVVSADFDAPLPTELQAGFDADTACEVRDSAGVELVVNGAADVPLELDEVLRIGVIDGDADYQFRGRGSCAISAVP